MTNIPFSKYHGLRNDFIVSAAEALPSEFRRAGSGSGRRSVGQAAALSRLARAICDRHEGVGADGFLVVRRSRKRGIDAAARFFNADGSEAEISGNGLRCIAAYLLENGRRRRVLGVETAAGLRRIEVIRARPGNWIFKVEMGEPILKPDAIPFSADGAPSPVVRFPLQTSRGLIPVTVTSMGNPHCTLFVDAWESMPWQAIGREIEVHPLFPHCTNVEFVRVLSPDEIEVRFWERGAGQTASSGTGSCAAVVASILNGLTRRRVRVRTSGGRLEVRYPENGQVLLTGPAAAIARGTFHFPPGP